MRGTAISFLALLCLATLGASSVAAPANRVPLPPSALITIADH